MPAKKKVTPKAVKTPAKVVKTPAKAAKVAQAPKVTKTVTAPIATSHKAVEAAVAVGKETVDAVVKAGTEAVTKGYDDAVAATKVNVVKASEAAFKGYDDVKVEGQVTFDAVTLANAAFTKGVEAFGQEVIAYAQTSVAQNVEAAKALTSAKTFKDVIELGRERQALRAVGQGRHRDRCPAPGPGQRRGQEDLEAARRLR
jgi:hypothetical protein